MNHSRTKCKWILRFINSLQTHVIKINVQHDWISSAKQPKAALHLKVELIHTHTYSQFNASILSREVSLPPQVRQRDIVSSFGVMMSSNKKG